VLNGIRERLDAIHDRHGMRVSLVGWSLGGLYARYLARQVPDKVRNVITLGSPLQMVQGDRSSASGIADRLQHLFDPAFIEMADHERGRCRCRRRRSTRTDGVVRWPACLDVVDATHENVEVRGSHAGLGFNPAVIYVVADRLAQTENGWQSFQPPLALRALYPRAASWSSARPARSA
jgi:pimeloyl-ACP methyl ester carboxylesterase